MTRSNLPYNGCIDCRHFLPSAKETELVGLDMGECHRFPPKPRREWPIVMEVDFCGEFELAPKPDGGGESNPQRFIRTQCFEHPDYEVTAADLYRAFVSWCRLEQWPEMTETTFGGYMTAMGFQTNSKLTKTYQGVKLTESARRVLLLEGDELGYGDEG